MPAERPLNLDSVFSGIVDNLGDVQARRVGAATEYRRREQAFAVVSDEATVELRLDPEVADAARRTPATSASPRGAEWVRFTPRTVEGHDRDRLEAWFLSAWRAAAGSGAE